MLEGIIQIGEAYLSEGDLLSGLVQKLNTTKKNKQLYILKIDFDTKDDKINVDVNEEMKGNSAYEYFFVGSADGANAPQWYASATSINYFITETIYNLTNIDLGNELNEKIKEVFEKFFVDLGKELKNKNRYVIDMKKYGISSRDVLEVYEELKSEGKEKFKPANLTKEYIKIFEEYLKENYGIKLNEIGLFTLLIDGKALAKDDLYKQAVLNFKTGGSKTESKKKEKISNKYCSICMKPYEHTTDLTKMKIKYFTTNQVIFASGVNTKKNYDKNMIICDECFKKYLAGETYVMNNLNTFLSGFTVYLIPHFIYENSMTKADLDVLSEKIKNSFNTVKNFNSAAKLREEVENTLLFNDSDDYFLLNLVFYKKVQKSYKIQRLIKDVNPSIFNKINEAFNYINNLSKKIYSSKRGHIMTLETIYYLTPIRLNNKGEYQEYNNLLDIYDAVFTGRKLDIRTIIDNILDVINIKYYEKGGFNVSGKGGIEMTIKDGIFYIKFLEYMRCLEGGKAMDTDELNLKDDIKNYINSMGYDEQKTAMFLLGYLIGQIGNSQYKNNPEGKKPILNKLNFSGVDKSKIIRLTGDIFNKLRQEKILRFNEMIFNEYKKLIDKNLDSWKLNKHENLFYILSGYGYATTKPMLSKENKGSEENGGSENE